MKRLKPFLPYLTWLAFSFFGFPLVLQELMYFVQTVVKVRPLQASTRDYLGTFLDDQKLLAEEPLFQIRQGAANAAPFLNYRIDWAPSTASAVRSLSANPPKLALPEEVATQIRTWGPQFPRHHSELRYETLDLSWFGNLAQFDYWDLIEEAAAEQVFENKLAMGLYFTQTLTGEFERFVLVAKARLMKGLYEGDMPSAVQETRQFARLLYTTETLMGELAAVAILRAERTVHDYLHENIQSGTGDWVAWETSKLDRARRAILGFNALFTVFTPPEVLQQAFKDRRVHVGVCSALGKGMLRGLLTRRLLEPQFLVLERDFRAPYRDLDRVIDWNANRCRLKHFREMWSAKESELVWLGLVGENSWDWINLHLSQHLPMIRKAWGVDLAALFLSNGLESYRQGLP